MEELDAGVWQDMGLDLQNRNETLVSYKQRGGGMFELNLEQKEVSLKEFK